MFSKLSEPQVRTLGFVAAPVVVIVSILLAHQLGGHGLAAIVALVATIVVALLSRALTPPWFGRLRSQIYSLAVLSAATLAVIAPEPLFLPILESLFKTAGLQPPTFPVLMHRVIVLAILAVAVITLNFIWSRQQITPPSDVAPDDAASKFENSGYRTLRDEFCRYMVGQLDQNDREVHWSDSDYRPLEAEIEIDSQRGRRPKLARDLVKAVHADRLSRAFLLLGEPGSGKSVSLRRLCRELYVQVGTTGIVPLYLNLREWDGPAEPTDSDISNFILRHLKFQSGRAGIRFLENWYEAMLERGLFFFIFDSFDEMPAVLDCDDASLRLQNISTAFDRFFNDLHRCRGILSSRFFRQPRGFRGRRLTIRQFSEKQVRGAMRRWLMGQPVDADKIVHRLFSEKPEFSSIVRNPFSADLVAQFLANNPNQLPQNYFTVFEDYVTRRLKEVTAGLKELDLTTQEVLDGATNTAWEMYNAAEVGLDVDVAKIRQLTKVANIEPLLSALRISRLARLGGTQIQRFSFAHRRFAEFFVVRKLMSQGVVIPLESIPSDSRWRDCLVVYCGIVSEPEARRLAEFSWATFREALDSIASGDLIACRPAIHCLRFLVDSFRGRVECISSFRNELSESLLQLLLNEDLLVAKIAAEGLCLVTNETREKGIAIAIERGVGWLSETAIRSCRHYGAVSERSQNALRRYITTLPAGELLSRFSDLAFSLSLSEGFRRIRFHLVFELISIFSIWIFWATSLALLILASVHVGEHSVAAKQAFEMKAAGITLSLATMVFVPAFIELFMIEMAAITENNTSLNKHILSVWSRLLKRLPFRAGFDTSIRIGIPIVLIVFFVFYDMGLFPLNLIDNSVLHWVIAAMCMMMLSWNSIQMVFEISSPRKILKRLKLLITNWRESLFPLLGVPCLALFIAFSARFSVWIFSILPKPLLYIIPLLGLASFIYLFARAIILFGMRYKHDLQLLAQMQIPEHMTRHWVYQMCGTLRSQWGRKRFLDVLLAESSRVEGAPLSSRGQPWMNSVLLEKIAKLEEKWLDLEL